jgi:HlyD family secretion protein
MKTKILIFVIVILSLVGVFAIYQKLNPKELPSYLIEGIGRINGDLINLNTKYAGRISKITIDDGDEVKKGEIIAVLNSKEYQKQKEALLNQIKAKNIELNTTKKELNIAIKKAEIAINVNRSKLKELNYNINSLKKVIAQDTKDYKRTKRLYQQKVAKKHDFEMATLKLKTDEDKLKALLESKKQLQDAINLSKNDLNLAKTKLESLKAMQKGIDALKAQEAQIEVIINELTLKSPINGFVDTKIANVGEVIGAGGVVATLIEPKSYYLSVFVDELNNGKIKIGDKAEIFLDNDLNHPIPAKVVSISQKAEFTPKEVAVRSDRITRVYEVHLKPLKENRLLKLGFPAIGVILIDENKNLPKSMENLPLL